MCDFKTRDQAIDIRDPHVHSLAHRPALSRYVVEAIHLVRGRVLIVVSSDVKLFRRMAIRSPGLEVLDGTLHDFKVATLQRTNDLISLLAIRPPEPERYTEAHDYQQNPERPVKPRALTVEVRKPNQQRAEGGGYHPRQQFFPKGILLGSRIEDEVVVQCRDGMYMAS